MTFWHTVGQIAAGCLNRRIQPQDRCCAKKTISFGSFTRELNVQQDQISYNEIVPPIDLDADGNELPHKPAALAVGTSGIYRLLKPYIFVRFIEQI
jgi:hypothetical protein